MIKPETGIDGNGRLNLHNWMFGLSWPSCSRSCSRFGPEHMSKPIRIHVQVERHTPIGLLAACSDDLPGLPVAGTSWREIEVKLPGAFASLWTQWGCQ